MTTTAVTRPVSGRPFAPFHRADRNAFLIFTAVVWVGILAGFGGDVRQHVAKHGLDYPLIVHVHAAAFVSWLILFTVQVFLIRLHRPDIHMKLGLAMLGLAAFMVVIGPATAIYMDHRVLGKPDADTTFVAIQLLDIVAFAGFVIAAAVWRARPSIHKRMMLMSLIFISDAGFARWLAPTVAPMIHDPFWSDLAADYLANDVLFLAFGAYDLATRGRLHPAYVGGLVWALGLQLLATALHLSPAFKPIALKLVGG
ncbi:hypothetical protein BH09PSE2_BH09PSE2_04420 [soil metagenome]